MKNFSLLKLTLLFCFVSLSLFSQKKFTISGYIEDASSGEKLIAANVYDMKSGQGAVSNTYIITTDLLSEKSTVFRSLSIKNHT